MAPYEDFGKRLTALRQNAGMTRAALGAVCGIAPSTIVNYEKGLRIPTADIAVKMAACFHLSVPALLGMDHPDVALREAEETERMRAIHGDKGAERLQAVYREARNLAGGDLSDAQLLEFSLEMTKMAQLAQQRLTERYAGNRRKETVAKRAEETARAVKALDDEIVRRAEGDAS